MTNGISPTAVIIDELPAEPANPTEVVALITDQSAQATVVHTPDTLTNTVDWFRAAVPTPEEKNKQVQVGVHLEEVSEFVQELVIAATATNNISGVILGNLKNTLNLVADHIKAGNIKIDFAALSRKRTLDAICDQMVTGAGLAYYLGMDAVGGLAEVNRSNFSKFVKGAPVFDENKKIRKGPNYTAPDLTPFI